MLGGGGGAPGGGGGGGGPGERGGRSGSTPHTGIKDPFPRMEQMGDITKLNGAYLPPVDIICGGSPCQDSAWPERAPD